MNTTLGLCTHRQVCVETLDSILRVRDGDLVQRENWIEVLEDILRANNIQVPERDNSFVCFSWNSEAMVERSRNILATHFLSDEALGDVLLFIDDDIVFGRKEVDRIVESCRSTKSVVGGIYTTRSDDDQFVPIRYRNTPGIMVNSGELVEVEYVSGGFMAIHRDVLKAMFPTVRYHKNVRDPGGSFYNFFGSAWGTNKDNNTEMFLSEDWAFCLRAYDLGFKIYADSNVTLGHIGYKMFTVNDLNKKKTN